MLDVGKEIEEEKRPGVANERIVYYSGTLRAGGGEKERKINSPRRVESNRISSKVISCRYKKCDLVLS